MMTIAERLADLRAKLKKRENVKGFERNCAAIREEIARLESLPADQDIDL